MKYLINPHDITDFNRTDAELEAFWLFCVLVAGKNSKVQAKKLANFLKPAETVGISPFRYIDLRQYKFLDEDIKAEKLGQYTRIHKCFIESLTLDLRNCTVEDLEAVSGVGPKTARFFLTHTRPNQQFAVLDTHVLKWLGTKLNDVKVPKATPSGETYRKLEKMFLQLCKDEGKTPAELDLEVWSASNGGVA